MNDDQVLWPGCGWQPVSLTDLIMAASVRKIYRKATLCVHPDKVQQKGATLQQKYVAEKVFDLLKVLLTLHVISLQILTSLFKLHSLPNMSLVIIFLVSCTFACLYP